jgi:hypothetical protein
MMALGHSSFKSFDDSVLPRESAQPAAAIAEAAKAFGQHDDITVITVGLMAAEKRREVKLTGTAWAPA